MPMSPIEAAIRQELIIWAQVRFHVRVDEEAIFGEVCRRLANLVTHKEEQDG